MTIDGDNTMNRTTPQEILLKDFIDMQQKHFSNALFEILVNGYKETHWCWYFFPNIPGLGTSENSKKYALDLDTYILFLQNATFRRNIFTMLKAVDTAYRNSVHMDIEYILGENPIDVLKWKSFLTLTWYAYLKIENLHDDWSHESNILRHDDWTRVSNILRYAGNSYGRCEKTIAVCRAILTDESVD